MLLKGQNNTEKCRIDYITYKESTIFHHNFSKINMDAEEGFFIEKKYPAIFVKVRSHYNIVFPCFLKCYF